MDSELLFVLDGVIPVSFLDPQAGKMLTVGMARKGEWELSWGYQVDREGVYWVAERQGVKPRMRLRGGPHLTVKEALELGNRFLTSHGIPFF